MAPPAEYEWATERFVNDTSTEDKREGSISASASVKGGIIMRHKLLVTSLSLSLAISVMVGWRGELILTAAAQQQAEVPPVTPAQVYPKRAEVTTPPAKDAQVAPLTPRKPPNVTRTGQVPGKNATRGFFRVTLN